jgi:hypothetical protein
MVNSSVHNSVSCGRTVGLIQEAAVLTWIGRWGFSAPTVLAMLTNKQVVPRLACGINVKVDEVLKSQSDNSHNYIKRERIKNPFAAAMYSLTLTKEGVARAKNLLARIKKDDYSREVAISRGFRFLLLDRTAPPPRIGRTKAWVFNHDIKLQLYVATIIRCYGDDFADLGFGFKFRADGMRTTRELESEGRSPGGRIPDFRLTGISENREILIGRRAGFIEFENSHKSADDRNRVAIFWSDFLRNSTAELLVLCDTEDILAEWKAAFTSRIVHRYKLSAAHRRVKTEEMVKIVFPDRTKVIAARWDIVTSYVKNPVPKQGMPRKTGPG